MKYYCDTNFVIRHLLKDNPEMFYKTKEIFAQVQTGKVIIMLEQTVFTEIIFVLSSFYKIPRQEIAHVLSELLAYKGITCEDKESLLHTLMLYSKHNIHIVDCLLIAKAEKSKVPLLSFDQKLLDIYDNRKTL